MKSKNINLTRYAEFFIHGFMENIFTLKTSEGVSHSSKNSSTT